MVAKKKTKVLKKTSNSPKTMDELLSLYGGSIKVFSRGDRVKGKVVEKRPKSLVLNIGGKSEGLVAEKAFDEAKKYIHTLNIGDEVEGKVIVSETPDGFTIISLRESAQGATWERLSKAKKEESSIKVVVKGVNPSGVLVEVFGLSGFIPSSHLGKEVSKNIQKMVGEVLEVAVIELDRKTKRIVLSEKLISEGEDMKRVSKALGRLKEGETYKGVVTTVSGFGAFVEIMIPEGKSGKVAVEGLVHVSEFAWEKVENASDFLSEGDKVEVVIIGVKDGKLALSMKQALKDPWEEAGKKYKQEAKVKGKVVKISDFGAFVEIEPGIEGLIHITKIPPDKKLKKGDSVNAYIEEINIKERKISLGLVLTAKPVGYK